MKRDSFTCDVCGIAGIAHILERVIEIVKIKSHIFGVLSSARLASGSSCDTHVKTCHKITSDRDDTRVSYVRRAKII